MQHRDILTGEAISPFSGLDHQGQAKSLSSEIQAAAGTELDGTEMLVLLDHLFPPLEAARDGKTFHRAVRSDSSAVEQRLNHPDYFGKFFRYEMATGDIAEGGIQELLSRVTEMSAVSTAVAELGELLDESPQQVTRALERRWRPSGINPPLFFELLALLHQSPKLDFTFGAFGGSARSRLVFFAAEVLQKFSEEDLVTYSGSFTDPEPAGVLLREVFLNLRSPAGSMEFVAWFQKERTELARELAEQLQTSQGIGERDTETQSLARDLSSLDKAAFRKVARLNVEARRWRADDLLLMGLKAIQRDGQPSVLDDLRVRSIFEDDPELVQALRNGERGAYPPDWTDPTVRVRTRIDSLSLREMAAYLLDNWDTRPHGDADED